MLNAGCRFSEPPQDAFVGHGIEGEDRVVLDVDDEDALLFRVLVGVLVEVDGRYSRKDLLLAVFGENLLEILHLVEEGVNIFLRAVGFDLCGDGKVLAV